MKYSSKKLSALIREKTGCMSISKFCDWSEEQDDPKGVFQVSKSSVNNWLNGKAPKIELNLVKLLKLNNAEELRDYCKINEVPDRIFYLPPPVHRFVDRKETLEEIKECLRKKESVGIFGMPGVGKSALALQVGYELRDDFKRIIFHSLDGIKVDDENQAVEMVAREIGFRFSEESSYDLKRKKAIVRIALSEHPTMLLLDNVQDETTLNYLLEAVSDCPVLVTSRDHMAPQSLNVLELLEFNRDDAIELFRIRASKESFSTEGKSSADIICGILGDLALAIEISAARVAILNDSLDEVKNSLEKRLFETLDARGIIEAKKSKEICVEISFDLSYERLSEIEAYPNLQQFFASVGVFRGSFTAEAAGVICQVADAEERLKYLHKLSLVKRIKKGRYSLHSLLREYAIKRMEDQVVYNRRMADYYFEFVDNNIGPLEEELKNTYGSLDWYESQNDWNKASSLLKRISEFLYAKGYWSDLEERCRNGLNSARSLRSEKDIMFYTYMLGQIICEQENYIEAKILLEESLGIARRVDDKSSIAKALRHLGIIKLREGYYEESKQFLNDALALGKELQNEELIAYVSHELGVILLYQKNYKEAREKFNSNLKLAEKINEGTISIISHFHVARIEFETGEYEQAKIHYKETLEIAERNRDKKIIAHALSDLGVIAIKQKRYNDARELLRKSLQIRKDLGERKESGVALYNLGYVELKEGHFKDAEESFKEGLQIAKDIDDGRLLPNTLQGLGRVIIRSSGDYEKAKVILEESLKTAKKLPEPRVIGRIFCDLGMIYQTEGSLKYSFSCFWKSKEISKIYDLENLPEIEMHLEQVKQKLSPRNIERLEKELTGFKVESLFEEYREE